MLLWHDRRESAAMDERKREELRQMIQVGIDQLERGEYTEHDQRSLKNLAKQIKTRGRRRLAQIRADLDAVAHNRA